MSHNDLHTLCMAGDNDSDSDEICINNDGRPPGGIHLEPINERLQKKAGYTGLVLQPRNYQRELYLKTLEENVIIFLGTGLGKTFIIVMFLRSDYIGRQIQANRKVVFLAPSQDLIKQQAEYINNQVLYTVKIYCGKSARCGQQIDFWDLSVWRKELANVDLFFMTPEILAVAIERGTLSFDNFASIIFDEVHHAGRKTINKESNHNYAKILRSYAKFYKSQPSETPRPRLIGLTASLFNTINTPDRIHGEIEYLEGLIDGKCVTISDVLENRPKSIIYSYTSSKENPYDPLIGCLTTFIESLKRSLKLRGRPDGRSNNYHNKLKLASTGISIKPDDFPGILEDLRRLYLDNGPWMLRSVLQKLVQALGRHQKIPSMPPAAIKIYQDYVIMLEKICMALTYHLDRASDRPSVLYYTQSKPMALLDALEMEYEKTEDGSNGKSSFSCIIFVISRLDVLALNSWLQEISSSIAEYKFIKCNYAIGQAGSLTSEYSCILKRRSNEQENMLADFRKGHYNTIVTTAVLEEGIDLPDCSTVIRYDQPQNFRQFVQSRGRARQDVSSIISICDSTMVSQAKEKLNKFHDFELQLKRDLTHIDIKKLAHQKLPTKEISLESDNYIISRKDNLTIELKTVTTIITEYCKRLAQRNYFTEGLQCEWIELEDNKFQTILCPPTGCPLNEGIRGHVRSSRELAYNSALLAFFKALDDVGELDELLSPNDNIDELLASKNLKPNFEHLDKSLEGLSTNEGGENATLHFEPELFRESGSHLSKNCANRVYKLIKIFFSSSHPDAARRSTKVFFEKPIIGLIVDSEVNFCPSELYGHYGQFKVFSYVISDNLLIKEEAAHNEYLVYTYKLLQDCLALRGISMENFKNRCQFYLVPLDADNKPNFSKMGSSSKTNKEPLETNDVVKFSHLYKVPLKKAKAQRSHLMLVKGTHISDSECKIGQITVSESNQLYVEVMPISGDFASASVLRMKKCKPDYNTASMYHQEKFIELVNYDAATVFQSYLLPPIIYQLYTTMLAVKFLRKFVEDTQAKRVDNVVVLRVLDPPLILDSLHLADLDRCQTSIRAHDDKLDLEQNSKKEKLVGTTMEIEQFLSNESDYDEDNISLRPQSIAIQEDLVLHEQSDVDSPKPCDSLNNKVMATGKLIHEYATSPIQKGFSLDSNTIEGLVRDLEPIQLRLTNGIRYFQGTFVSETNNFEEEMEFKKRLGKIVDHSIKPPVHFDRNTTPVLEKPQEKGIIEALTQRRAGEKCNLETLENIGDSYLKYVVSLVLFLSFENDEGVLTSMRSRLICNKYFTHLAMKNNLGSLAITSSLSENILSYILGKQMSNKEEMKKFYNKMRPKNLADTFESIIGANLIYQGEFEAITAIKWLGLNIFKENTFEEFHERAVVFSRSSSSLLQDISDNADIYRSCRQKVQEFQKIIGYTFNDPSYLIQAFTHPSSVRRSTPSYERLEFLGDSILDILVTITLVKIKSTNNNQIIISPGQITSSRSALVNNVALARLSLAHNYDLYIQYNNYDLYDELNKVRLAMEKDPSMVFLDMLDYDKIVKLLADVFESVAAAIYLDSGNSLDTVWGVYYPMMKDLIDLEANDPTKNPAQTLYEAFPGPGRISFKASSIPKANGDLVCVSCRVHYYDEDKKYCDFKGRGMSQKEARQRAVLCALKNIPSSGIRDRLKEKFYLKSGK